MTGQLRSDRPPASASLPGASAELEDLLRRDGFAVGEWRVEPRRHRIVSDAGVRPLDPRLIDLLIALAVLPGEVLTRDELLRSVWKGTFVQENSLSQAISRLRRALGDDAGDPRYIETISRSGYRLVAAVDRTPAATGREQATAYRPLLFWAGAASLAALSLALTFDRSRAPSPPAAQVRPELTLVGNQFEPRLSPDGEHLAFAWQGAESASWDIWLQPIGADNPVRVTDHADPERLTAWSPDGQRLAFVRFSPQQKTCGIFSVPIVGGAAERLGDCIPGMRSLAWSPDGGVLAFDGFVADSSSPRALFLLDLARGERLQLTTPPAGILGDTGARFSPDGRLLAFTRKVGPFRHDVAVTAVTGGEVRLLTADRWGQVRGVDWTSDGAAVLLSSNRTGQFALWRVAVGGGTPERLPIHDAWVTQPSVSRAGGRLIYRTFRDAIDIWELPLDAAGEVAGEPLRRVPSSRSEQQPAWSPEGDAIAFISDRSGSLELWSGRPGGTELIRHTDLEGPLPGSPAWSPDGRFILFDAAVDGRATLWRVDRQSRRPQRLVRDSHDNCNGSFSRDGEKIYFASNREGAWDIWSVPAAGGAARRITAGGGFLAQESPDGARLYYARLEEPGIWRLPASGGEAERVLSDLDLPDWGSWVVADHGIYYLRRGPTTIAFADFDGAEPRSVYTPPKQIPFLGRALSLSADGRSLLFSMIDHSDDEVMTVDLAGL